ncbi:MAG: hypothetical protein CVT59_02775 [Actinobacteria bacterium HGW-Actinobacteria-1]|jgi:hypothetical protein|nr:MAG: hypothetical protein CVT59_02775 [Actinobacteria bacterium HGW-Actinobacteria-1]
MATLSDDPLGLELEDFVAAHFAARGCYVETGIKERDPDELLELDIVWTDYGVEAYRRHAVEVKSGDWGLGDLFKFFGWTQYLGLPPGQFFYRQSCGRLDPASLKHVADRSQVLPIHVEALDQVDQHFDALGLAPPSDAQLPEVWRFSFWAQRRLLRSLGVAIGADVCPETAKAAKRYHQLVNDAVFFLPDVRDSIAQLVEAHFDHQQLGKTAAHEIDSGVVDFSSPASSETFTAALFGGRHFPVQACLYLAHRARLYLLKALVDYQLARDRGEIVEPTLRIGGRTIDFASGSLTTAMAHGVRELSEASAFHRFPALWQTFLWAWGGFILTDRQDEEFAALSASTGVPVDEIPLALTAFDKLFPAGDGWFRQPGQDARNVLMLMPAAMRGIGSFHRLQRAGVEEYRELGFTDYTASRMASDHNSGARLLDCRTDELAD